MLKLNGHQITPTIFPDKTSQVWKLPDEAFSIGRGDHHRIEWCFEGEGEFLHLNQLKALLDIRHEGIPCKLFIDYLPYARQDKLVSNETTFALYPFIWLLNQLGFEKIGILDPHSSVASLIKKGEALYPFIELDKAWTATESELAAYPDKGAAGKYAHLYHFDYVCGQKVRDQSSGDIMTYDLVQQHHRVEGKKVLIVDDICDGGATFVCLAKSLYSAGATSVNLFVTHGLFTKGLEPLFNAGIRRIFSKKGEHTL
jgi:ribose-phosphate pyrophosphokinase